MLAQNHIHLGDGQAITRPVQVIHRGLVGVDDGALFDAVLAVRDIQD